jgi:6-phosphogluconolactonase
MLSSWDARRDLFKAKSHDEAIAFAVEHFIHSGQRAIQQKGRFAVALSGGSTPKTIYEQLAKRTDLDWSKVFFFWSDERAVPPDHPDSNYRLALNTSLLALTPPDQIFRMEAEKELSLAAANYAETIERLLSPHLFDLVLLGLGEDGHTASLFPETKALNSTALAAANPVPQKKTSRLTLTFPCINQSARSVLYALGPSKRLIVPKVLGAAIDSPFPASRIGTPEHKALWILDPESASLI